MIYSKEINKVCAVCQKAKAADGEKMYCEIKKQDVEKADKACDKFIYDILKRPVRRMRRLKTNYKKEDFTL